SPITQSTGISLWVTMMVLSQLGAVLTIWIMSWHKPTTQKNGSKIWNTPLTAPNLLWGLTTTRYTYTALAITHCLVFARNTTRSLPRLTGRLMATTSEVFAVPTSFSSSMEIPSNKTLMVLQTPRAQFGQPTMPNLDGLSTVCSHQALT